MIARSFSLLLGLLVLGVSALADTTTLTLRSAGSARNNGSTSGTPYLGYDDWTWPSDDDLHRAYFWWNGGVPAGTAIESARILSITTDRERYSDDDWFRPRGAKINATWSTWNGWNGSSRYNACDTDAQTPRYYELGGRPSADPYTVSNIAIQRSHFAALRAGDFGLGFNFDDHSGGTGDDSTRSIMSAGDIQVTYWSTPGLTAPAESAAFESGAPVTFTWGNAMSTYSSLVYRLQVSRQSNFSSLVTNAQVAGTFYSFTPIDGGTYYWRLRIEDISQSGNESNWSAARSFSVTVAPVPAAPTGVDARDGLHTGFLRVTWSAVAYAANYEVYRSSSSTFASATLIATIGGTLYDDATAPANAILYYWVKAKNASGASAPSAPDTGFRANGGVTTLGVDRAGSIWYDHDGDWGSSGAATFGWADNQYPVDDDHYIAYLWWDGSELPGGVALDYASYAWLGFTDAGYEDSDWAYPRAGRIPHTFATWNAAGSDEARWNLLNSVYSGSAHLLSIVTNLAPNPSLTVGDVALFRQDLLALLNGSGFGLAFDAADTSGGTGDDSTRMNAEVGPLTAGYYGAPALTGPASGASYASGAPVTFTWNGVGVYSASLRHRLQIARDAGFTNLVANLSTTAQQHNETLIDGATYFWRVRVEDKDYGANASAWSAARQIVVSSPVSAPAAPHDLSASDGLYTEQVLVSWTAQPLASSYQVFRGTTANSAAATLRGTTNDRFFADTTATAGVTYHYWVKALNSVGASAFSNVDTGYRAQDQALTLTVNPSLQGSIENDTVWGLSEIANTTFGLDDGDVWNTIYRAYIWWDISALPADAAIDTAAFSYLGYDRETFTATTEKQPRAVRIGASRASFNAASLEARFTMLDTSLDVENALFTHTTATGTPHRVYNVALSRGLLATLRSDSALGLAFGSTETDDAVREDSNLLLGRGGALTVRYFQTPALQTPAHNTTQAADIPVEFSWAANLHFGSGTYLRYRLQVATDAGFSNVVYNRLLQTASLAVPLDDNQRYYWRLRIEDVVSGDNHSAWSPTRNFLIPLPVPAVPHDLAATDGADPNQVLLTWSPVLKAATYEVRRGTSEQFSASTLLSTVGVATYADASAAPGVRYHYWVRAVNQSGASADSTDSGFRGLGAPGQVTATDGGNAITITWSPTPNAAGYQIWRNTISDTASLSSPLATVGSGVTSYQDATAVDGQNYVYWVKAIDALGSSGFSGGDGGYRGIAPAATVSASDGSDLTSVRIQWSAVVGASTYEVLKAEDLQLSHATLLGRYSDTNCVDAAVDPGRAYTYWVRTVAGNFVSNTSAPDAGYRGIPAPATVTASDALHPDRVAITWASVPQAVGYRVLRAASNERTLATPISLQAAGTVAFDDENVEPGAEFFYWVEAYDAVATSQAGSGDAGSLAPSNLLATDGAHSDKVALTWEAAARATGYTVWRGFTQDVAHATQIATTQAGVRAFSDSTVAAGQSYHYWVKATLPVGASGFSNADAGNAGAGMTVTLPILTRGFVRNGSTEGNTPHFGWIDNTWPSSDDHTRGYIWWNTASMPAGVAVESANIASLGYQKVTYTDTEWSNPTARRLEVAKSAFDGTTAAGRWDFLAPTEAQPIYFSVPLDQGATHSVANIAIHRDDLHFLKASQSFGLAFTGDDTTGEPVADDTYLLATAGAITVRAHGAPALAAPAPGSLSASGSPVDLQWAAAFAKNARLQYRVQIASDAAFTQLLVNTATSRSEFASPIKVGANRTLHWRVRVEDTEMALLPAAQLHDPVHNFSAWSAARTFVLSAPTERPGQVQRVIASDGSYGGSVRLLWDEQALAEYYDIYRGFGQEFGSATLVATVEQGTHRWFDTTAGAGTSLTYWVVARNSVGSAPPSEPEIGLRGADPITLYFPQSVASGSPTPDSVVLWTRVWDASLPAADHLVRLEMATDAAFQNVVHTRQDLRARAAHDHCIKVKVNSLSPFKTYYYRFGYLKPGHATPNWSRVGRTKTAPLPDQDVPVRFAFLSCQDMIGKYYNSLHDMVLRHQDVLDFVMWCGDYIYETTGNPEFQTAGSERNVDLRAPGEAIDMGGYYAARSLGNYRDLYRAYRSDPALQRVHELFPAIITWDDHEFSDDNHGATASYLDEKYSEFDPVRKRNSEQAFLEYLPTDNGMDSFGVAITAANLYPNWAPLYSTWKFGANCEVILSDFRSYRPDHLVPESAFPGEVIMTEAEVRTALKAVKGWNDAQLNARWAGLKARLDAYDPGFDSESAFGLAVQAAVIYWYQQNEGLSYAEAVGVAKEKVKPGRLSANFVNLALELAGVGIQGYSADEIASFPRGLSYAYLAKVLPYGPIGARYGLIHDNFNLFAWHRWQATGGGSENVYGDKQMQWIHDTLNASTARWKLFVNSTSFTPMLLDIPTLRSWVPITIPELVPDNVLPLLENQVILNGDAWDGFPFERRKMIDLLSEHRAVVLAGDIHSTWITRHFASSGKMVPEFTGTSVSSGTVYSFFDTAMHSFPQASGLVDLDAVKNIMKPLFMASDRFSLSPAEIVDCELGANGYMFVECTSAGMRVLRHEMPAVHVSENYYDSQLASRLTELVHVTEHRVEYSGPTLSLSEGLPVAQNQPYNRSPHIEEGDSVSVNLTQNNFPAGFNLVLHGTDEDSDALTWRLLSAPQHGETRVTNGPGGLTATIAYQPNRNFKGIDAFEVELTDAHGAVDVVKVYANVAASSPLDLWRWHYFHSSDPTGVDPTIWAMSADPDQDGRSNLAEFALGKNPTTGAELPPIVATVVTDGVEQYLAVRFQRRKADVSPGLRYQIATSHNMSDWATLNTVDYEEAAPPVSISNDLEEVVIRLKTPIQPDSVGQYIRLLITQED